MPQVSRDLQRSLVKIANFQCTGAVRHRSAQLRAVVIPEAASVGGLVDSRPSLQCRLVVQSEVPTSSGNVRVRGAKRKTFARTQFFSVCPQWNVPSRPPRMRRRSHLAPSAFGTETFSSLNDLLPGLRKMRGIHEPSFRERRVPYGRDHERHFPGRGRALHFDWNALKERAIWVTRRCEV